VSDTLSRVRGVISGPGTRTWRAVRSHLPSRVAEAVRAPLKRALRRVGLLDDRDADAALASQVARIRVGTFSGLVGEGRGRTLLDLGAGPCIFAAIARDMGWVVTAVDARTERLPAPDKRAGITFVEADIRSFDPSGFDTVAILGLLYHLPLEEQRALLTACSYTRVILETQVHTPGFVPPAAEPWGRKVVVRQGLEGVVFPERKGGALEGNPMASVGNPTSFWLTEPSLLELIDSCGYRSIEVASAPFASKYGTRRFYVLNGAA
jgi:hypothetical protein